MSRRTSDRVVYSSEQGRVCPHCHLPTRRCVCRANPRGPLQTPAGERVVRVGRQSKGRKGKPVSTVSGLSLPPDELRELATALRRRCGSGGTVKDGVIEVQGEHRDTLVGELEARGFRVKRSGG